MSSGIHRRPPSGIVDIRPLTVADLERLRLRRHFRFDLDEVRAMLEASPDSSFWIPDTDELILVGTWRNRPDLMAIHGLSATANESVLISHAVDQVRSRGMTALLMVDAEEMRRPIFYARNGFLIIDRIATYELAAHRHRSTSSVRDDLSFTMVDPADVATMQEVEALDHQAFPWFWWNVREEFESYSRMPEVEIWIGLLSGRIVSYIGITHYRGWGHLDRIATTPDFQRGGIGAATLEEAIRLLRLRGATRIALSTQGENLPAQAMYERRGFERTLVHDYTVFGYILEPDKLEPMRSVTLEIAEGARSRKEKER